MRERKAIQRGKGQIFLIAAVVIVSSLLILKMSATLPVVTQERKEVESVFEASIYFNVVRELNNTMTYSYHEPRNITRNVHDFGNFTRDRTQEHSLGMQFFFVGSLANKSTNVLNVSAVNLLRESVDVNLTLNSSQSDSSSLADYGRFDTSFTITPGETYVLTATYNQTSENITIQTRSDKDVYVGFVDLTLKAPSSIHKAKYQKEFDLQ